MEMVVRDCGGVGESGGGGCGGGDERGCRQGFILQIRFFVVVVKVTHFIHLCNFWGNMSGNAALLWNLENYSNYRMLYLLVVCALVCVLRVVTLTSAEKYMYTNNESTM